MSGLMMNGLPRLATTESTSMPVLANAISWRTWSAGLAEAAQRQVPLLVVAEPGWVNSAHRLAAMLAEDERLRAACEGQVVPVLVDPTGDDAPIDQWRLFSVVMTGSLGPPLILVLSDEGLPLLSYTSMTYEGDANTPSLASVIQAMADAWQENAEAVRQECRSLDEAMVAAHSEDDGQVAGWSVVEPLADRERGGLAGSPRHPQPQVLLGLMESPPETAARAWVETTLEKMAAGGIRDQLDRGFFRCARDGGWVVPHFEKPIPLNAQLAVVYARAAAQYGRQDFREVAVSLVQFCQIALRDGVDRIASESGYYTWTSREVKEAVKADTLQVVCLHYGIIPGARRCVLSQTVLESDLGRFGHQPLEEMQAGLARGKAQMAAVRKGRPYPGAAAVASLSWRAETIRWLYEVSASGIAIDKSALANALDRLTVSMGEFGYAQAQGVVTIADQAAILRALQAAFTVDGDARWQERAAALGAVMVSGYVRDGVVFGTPLVGDGARQCWGVVDGEISATLPNVIAGLRDLAQHNDDADLRLVAEAIEVRSAGMMARAGVWAASAWA